MVIRNSDRPGLIAALENTPFSVQWQEIDGTRTRILQVGSADKPPLVMVHGIGSHADTFLYNAPALSANWHVVAYDLPGHGWSSTPERSYEIAGYCSHLEGVLWWLGAPAAVLCGHSLGGWISARFAATHPDSVGALLLVAPGGTLANPETMSTLRDLSRAAAAEPTHTTVRQRMEVLVADPSCLTDEMVDLRVRTYNVPDARDRTERVLTLQQPDVRSRNLLTQEELGSIACPTLVVAGEHDSIVPVNAARACALAIPGAQLEVLPGCAHWPHYEQPEQFNELARSWLGAAPR